MSFLSQSVGPYLVSYAGSDIGDVEGVLMLQVTAHAQLVRANRFGDAIIDFITRGATAFAVMNIKEWTAATKATFWPFSGTQGLTGLAGRLGSDIAAALLLTAITGTPAATLGPVTRTYAKAIYAPEFNKEIVLGAEERNIPLTLLCLPTEVSATTSEIRLFTDT